MDQKHQDRKTYIQNGRKIVIKLGTKVLLSHCQHLHNKRIIKLIDDIAWYIHKGYGFSIVSSGAVGFGMRLLGIEQRPTDLKKIQACASLGQSLLMQKWNELFSKRDIHVGQILLTYDIIENRQRFLYARDCIKALINYHIIPIVNENDSVAVDELKFGDNDTLSALTANLMDADLLILFTDTDGVFNKNPHKYKDAKRIPFIDHLNDDIFKLIDDKQDQLSSGGMRSKLIAAQRSIKGGCGVIITNGYHPDLRALLNGKDVGTFIKPDKKYIKKRKNWIFLNHRIKGKVFIDEGAAEALKHHLKSLLPGGVVKTEQNFPEGSIVGIFDMENRIIGKGISYYSSVDIDRIKGHRTSEIEKILGERFYDVVIHRDNMIIL